MPKQKSESLRVAVDVEAGVLVGTPELEFTKRYYITSGDWNDPEADHAALLTEMVGKATGWATYCMLQPDRFNWVKTEWVWF